MKNVAFKTRIAQIAIHLFISIILPKSSDKYLGGKNKGLDLRHQ